MKICMVVSSYYPEQNGGATNVNNRLRILSKEHHQVLLIVPDYDICRDIYPNYRQHQGEIMPGITVIPVPSRYAVVNYSLDLKLFSASYIQSLVDEFRPDVVLVESPERLMFGAMQLIRPVAHHSPTTPVIAIHHTHYVGMINAVQNDPSFPYMRYIGALFAWLTKRLISFVYSSFDASIVNSPTAINYLDAYGASFEKLRLIPFLGINITPFEKARLAPWPPHSSIADQLVPCLPIDRPHRLLYLGRLAPEKNIDLLMAVFDILLARRCDVSLLLLGGGEPMFEERIRAWSKDKPVFMSGRIDNVEVPSLYQLGTVFVHPGAKESAGITPMEAMASGLPVIGVDAGGVGDIIKHGVNGLKSAFDNTEHMAELVEQVLDNKMLRKRLISGGMRYVKQRSDVTGLHAILDLANAERKRLSRMPPHVAAGRHRLGFSSQLLYAALIIALSPLQVFLWLNSLQSKRKKQLAAKCL